MSQKRFSIQFVGTGNAWSKPPVNFNTNAIVHVDDKMWLIDCGLLCPLALSTLNIPQEKISGIYVSHLHGDHAYGLEELLFYNYFAHSRRLDLWLPSELLSRYSQIQGSDIWDNCLRASMETWVDHEQRLLQLEDFVTPRVMFKDTDYNIFGIPARLLPVEHVSHRPTFGLVLDNRIAYTSDCKYSRQRIDQLLEHGISTIFHEVTFAPARPGNIHTSFEEIATLPRDIAAKIYLMHYGDKASDDDFKRAEDLGFHIARRGIMYDF